MSDEHNDLVGATPHEIAVSAPLPSQRVIEQLRRLLPPIRHREPAGVDSDADA